MKSWQALLIAFVVGLFLWDVRGFGVRLWADWALFFPPSTIDAGLVADDKRTIRFTVPTEYLVGETRAVKGRYYNGPFDGRHISIGLAVAYPSAQAWPPTDESSASRLFVEIFPARGTLADSSPSQPSTSHAGYVKYDLANGSGYYPLVSSDGGESSDEIICSGPVFVEEICVGRTVLDDPFVVEVTFRRSLLPDWPAIRDAMLALVRDWRVPSPDPAT